MDDHPKRLITRILEFAGLFALSAFLIRLGACWLLQIRWFLLVLVIVIASAAVIWRVWRNRGRW